MLGIHSEIVKINTQLSKDLESKGRDRYKYKEKYCHKQSSIEEKEHTAIGGENGVAPFQLKELAW